MEEARTPMPWGDEQDSDLLGFYQRLIAWRREHLPLLGGERTVRDWSAEGLYVTTIGDKVMLALNRTDTSARLSTPAQAVPAVTTSGDVRHAGDDILMPPFSGALLALPSPGTAS
jgi:glycosidase